MPIGRGHHHRGHYGHRRGIRLGGTVNGRGMSKGAAKCFAVVGVAVMIAAIVMVIFGILCITGVVGRLVYIGTPLLSLGTGLLMTSTILLMITCQAAMQRGKSAPAPTYGQGGGLSTAYPSAFQATPSAFPATQSAFQANPGAPPPFQSAVQPIQPPPYSWTSPAPLGGTQASSVQGPYSGFQYTSFADPGNGNANSIPNVSS